MEGLNADQLQALVQAVAQGLQAAAAAGGAQAQAPAAAPNAMARMGLKMDHFDNPDPASWIKWRYKFENYARLMEWTQPQAKRALIALVSGDAGFVIAGSWTMDQVDAPGEPQPEPAGGWGDGYGAGNAHNRPFSLAALLDVVEGKILAGRGGQQALSEFQEAAQMVGESVQAYHGRLHSIYLRAFPDMPANLRNTDKILITRFVNGIRDKAVSLTVQQNNPMNDFNRALELVAQAEAGKLNFERENAKTLGAKGALNALMVAGRKKKDAMRNLPPGLLQKLGLNTSPGTPGTCHNCGKPGHLKRHCWSPPSAGTGPKGRTTGQKGGKATSRNRRQPPRPGKGKGPPGGSRGQAVAKLLNQDKYRRLLAQLNSMAAGEGDEEAIEPLPSDEGEGEETTPDLEAGVEELLQGLNALKGGEDDDLESRPEDEDFEDYDIFDQEL